MLTAQIRGISINDILGIVHRVESRALKHCNVTTNHNSYIKHGRWLIKTSYVKSNDKNLLFHQLSPVYNLGIKDKLKIYLKLLLPFKSACNADLICVKQHIRSFYLSTKPYTVKIFSESHGVNSYLEKEEYIRRTLSKTKLINIPKLRGSGKLNEYTYLVEDVVDGEPLIPTEDHQLVMDFLDTLWEQYIQLGLELRSSKEFISTEDYESIKTYLSSLDWRNEWGEFQVFLNLIKTLLEDDLTLLCSIGHGDLSLGNMLKTNKSVYLLDWEHAGIMPVAFDLTKLSFTYPDIIQLFSKRTEDEMKHLTTDSTPLKTQIALGCIYYILGISKNPRLHKSKPRLHAIMIKIIKTFSYCYPQATAESPDGHIL